MYTKRLLQALPFLAALLLLIILAAYARIGGYAIEIPTATATFDFNLIPQAPKEGITFIGWMQPGQACQTDNNSVSNQGEFTQSGSPDLLIDPKNKESSPQLKTLSETTLKIVDGIVFSYDPDIMDDNVAVWAPEGKSCSIYDIR